MRPLAFALFAVVAAAAPAAAQKVGERTGSLQDLLGDLGGTGAEAGLDREVAAAAAHPLGTIRNPVRVGGPEGAQTYVARLRCAGGARPRLLERTSGGVGAYGTIVDIYSLDCGAAAPGRFDLVVDMYHAEHREDRAPAGFTLE